MNDNELLILITRIQAMMVDVSTGGSLVQDVNNKYRELYFKIQAELSNRQVNHKNTYSSLWDFYNYWKDNLPSYQDRRNHVRELYRYIDDMLRLNIYRSKKQASDTSQLTSYSFSFDNLHEEIIIKCKTHFENENYDEAIHNATKLIETKVRDKGGYRETDFGVKLIDKAFSIEDSPFLISEDPGEVAGWKFLMRGSIQALKNPQSHRFVNVSKLEAFQVLVFVSFLLSFIDNLQIKTEDDLDMDDIPW